MDGPDEPISGVEFEFDEIYVDWCLDLILMSFFLSQRFVETREINEINIYPLWIKHLSFNQFPSLKVLQFVSQSSPTKQNC